MRHVNDPHRLQLPLDEWNLAKASVPIACTDIVVTREAYGLVTEVALIRRRYRDGNLRWCHLGGRVGLDEQLTAAALRHVETTIDIPAKDLDSLRSGFPSVPVTYFEFMRFEDLGSSETGLDPDKHAISWCYRLPWIWDSDPRPVEGGEAEEVKWFPVAQLPDDVWPGTTPLVRRVTASMHVAETYASISSQADTHNTLMWQTPVLAMTAQAFLLTIALGSQIHIMSRLAAATLSLVVSLLSMQLMLKHSAMQLRDNVAREQIERTRGMALYHMKPSMPGSGLKAWLVRQKSRNWWLAGMGIFGLVSLAVAVVSIVHIR